MKVVAFIEPPQADVIERILRHCGLWNPSSPRASPAKDGWVHDPDDPSDGRTPSSDERAGTDLRGHGHVRSGLLIFPDTFRSEDGTRPPRDSPLICRQNRCQAAPSRSKKLPQAAKGVGGGRALIGVLRTVTRSASERAVLRSLRFGLPSPLLAFCATLRSRPGGRAAAAALPPPTPLSHQVSVLDLSPVAEKHFPIIHSAPTRFPATRPAGCCRGSTRATPAKKARVNTACRHTTSARA